MLEKIEPLINTALLREKLGEKGFQIFERQKNTLAQLEQIPEHKRTADDKTNIVSYLLNMGETLMFHEFPLPSIDYFLKSLAILEKADKNLEIWSLKGRATLSLGSAYAHTDNPDNFAEAEKYLMLAFEIFCLKTHDAINIHRLKLNDLYAEFEILFLKKEGLTAAYNNDPSEISELRLYSELARQKISGRKYANRLVQLGHLYLSRGLLDRAKIFFIEAKIGLCEKKVQYRNELAKIYEQLALIEKKKLLPVEAIANFLSALNNLTLPEHAADYLSYCSQLASLYLECGKFEEVLSLLPPIISALSEVQLVLPQEASIDLLKTMKLLLEYLLLAQGLKNDKWELGDLQELDQAFNYFLDTKSDNSEQQKKMISSEIESAYENLIQLLIKIAEFYENKNSKLSMFLFTFATTFSPVKEQCEYWKTNLLIAKCHLNRGIYFYGQKALEKAYVCYTKAIETANQIPEQERTIDYYEILTSSYYDKLPIEFAKNRFNDLLLSLDYGKAQRIFDQKIFDNETLFVVWNYKINLAYKMATLYQESKNLKEANASFHELSNLLNEIPIDIFASLEFALLNKYHDLGLNYFNAQNFKKAEEFCKKSINAAEKKEKCLIPPKDIRNEMVLNPYNLLVLTYGVQCKPQHLSGIKNKTLNKIKLTLEESNFKNEELSLLFSTRKIYKDIYATLSRFTAEHVLKDFLNFASLVFTENNLASIEKITVFYCYVAEVKDFDQFSSLRKYLVHVIEIILLAAEKELLPDSPLKKSLRDPEILENLKELISEINARHQSLKELIGTHSSLLDAFIYRERDHNEEIKILKSEIELLKKKSEPDNSLKLKRKNEELINDNHKKQKVSTGFFEPKASGDSDKKTENSSIELGSWNL